MRRTTTEPLVLAAATVLAVVGAATSLHAVTTGGHWFLWVVLTAALVVGTSTAARRPQVPALVVPLALPVVLLLLVTATTVPSHAFLGFVPTSHSLSDLQAAARAGLDQCQTYAAPVRFTHEIRLLTIVAVFVVAAVVDLLVMMARRPALAGLPLLVLWIVPSFSSGHGVGFVALTAATASFLLLLAAERRVRSAPVGRSLPTPLLGRTGFTVAGVSVTSVLLIGALLPGVGNGVLGDQLGRGKNGNGSITVIAPLVTVETRLHDAAETELFTVDTDQEPQYLRMTALDSFDGGRFTLDAETTPSDARVSRSVPPAPGPADVPTTTVNATVSVGPLAESYLPLPYSPTRIEVSSAWVLGTKTRTVFSTSATTKDLRYRVTARVPTPSPDLLRGDGAVYDPTGAGDQAATLAEDLKVPQAARLAVQKDLNTQTAGLTTMYDKALALQTWFQSDAFDYDLNASVGSGAAGIADFLKNKSGYCEQFATAMVVMARTAGIPARVAVGFTPGTLGDDGLWHVTTKDAHAWPELWFDSAGWVRFEPTPRGDTADFDPGYTPSTRPGTQPTAAPTTQAPAPTASLAPESERPSADKETGGPTRSALAAAGGGSGSLPGWVPYAFYALLVLAAVAALLASPGLLAGRVRRRRLAVTGPLLAHRAWMEMLADVRDSGLRVPAGRSPRTVGASLAEVLTREAPDAASAALRVAQAEERARYARPGAALPAASQPDGEPDVEMTRDLQLVRSALLGRAPALARVRMRLLPSSLLPAGVLADGGVLRTVALRRAALRGRLFRTLRRG